MLSRLDDATKTEPEEIRLHGSPAVRWVLVACGWVALGLGVVGIFLPLLPTTPFVLLAGACFVRGSKRVHRWLLATRPFGPIIREWRAQRTVSRRTKVVAQVLIVLSFGSSVAFFIPVLWARIVVAAMGVVAFVLVSRLRVGE
jgi:uncharacterized membrane protein YbaN (DUF454 family)